MKNIMFLFVPNRDKDVIAFSTEGGIEIEENWEKVIVEIPWNFGRTLLKILILQKNCQNSTSRKSSRIHYCSL